MIFNSRTFLVLLLRLESENIEGRKAQKRITHEEANLKCLLIHGERNLKGIFLNEKQSSSGREAQWNCVEGLRLEVFRFGSLPKQQLKQKLHSEIGNRKRSALISIHLPLDEGLSDARLWEFREIYAKCGLPFFSSSSIMKSHCCALAFGHFQLIAARRMLLITFEFAELVFRECRTGFSRRMGRTCFAASSAVVRHICQSLRYVYQLPELFMALGFSICYFFASRIIALGG